MVIDIHKTIISNPVSRNILKQKIIKHDIFKYVISIKYVITIVFMTS